MQSMLHWSTSSPTPLSHKLLSSHLLSWVGTLKPIYKYYKLKLMGQPWGLFFLHFCTGHALCYQDKTCQSTCLKVIPLSRANITRFISDQWHFAAHVKSSTLNLPLFISAFQSSNHSGWVPLLTSSPHSLPRVVSVSMGMALHSFITVAPNVINTCIRLYAIVPYLQYTSCSVNI